MQMDIELNGKYEKLKGLLEAMNKAAVCFSGGVDSALLLKASIDTLGPQNVLALTIVSALYPESERCEARESARSLKARVLEIDVPVMDVRGLVANGPDRCYHCKAHLFSVARDAAQAEGCSHILEGSNTDDLKDYRPGRAASIEAGIKSPFIEAGLSKADIRAVSKALGLVTHDKPAQACLASRIPYGTEITVERLRSVEHSETFIRLLGIRQVRVRHHGSTARIEVEEKDLPVVIELRNEIADKLITFGFTYVSLDLKGYRTGSMNDQVEKEQ